MDDKKPRGAPPKPKYKKLNQPFMVNCSEAMAGRIRNRRRLTGQSYSAQFVAAMEFWESRQSEAGPD